MMTQLPFLQRQRGTVLVIGLIMLVLITLMVTVAYKFSTTNLKSVGNMQSRNEATASATKAIEQVVGSWNFGTAPVADEINVDIDNDGVTDYIVKVAAPVCVKATATTITADLGGDCPPGSDGLFHPENCPKESTSIFNTVWDIDATATSSSGTRVRVRQGISKSISKDQCDAACPPAPGAQCA